MFSGKMVTPAIPERVYLIYRLLQRGPVQENKLRKEIEPNPESSGTSYYPDVRTCAEELGLITNSENVLSINKNVPELKTITDFRIYVNTNLEKYSSGSFYRVTRQIMNMNIEELKKVKNIGDLSGTLTQQLNPIKVDEASMRGWRFWASFLGLGMVNDMYFIPNAAVFIQDLIGVSDLEYNKSYSVSEFWMHLSPRANIAAANLSDRHLNYGISSGLRTLHDQGYLELSHKLDMGDIWTLYRMKSHLVGDTINRIEIKKKEPL